MAPARMPLPPRDDKDFEIVSEPVQSWTVPTVAEAEGLISAAAERFPSKSDPVEVRDLDYLDTFDRRVARRGEMLVWQRKPGRPHLCRTTGNGAVPQRFPLERCPDFADDLPSPARALARRIEMRRLLPEVRLRVERRVLRVLDGRRKTVARLALEFGRAYPPGSRRGRALPPIVSVEPVKGYERRARALAEWVGEQKGIEPAKENPRDRALLALGIDPVGPSLPERPAIERGQPAVGATRGILLRQLDVILLNESGTREALDTEFLHDYRVAVRRTRSALGQIKGVFEPRKLERYRREFAWLGAITGPVRDLDVYLLTLPEYRSWLPASGAHHLDALETLLVHLQTEAQQELVRAMNTARYRRLLESWGSFLAEESTKVPGAPNARRPVEEVAAERIHRVWTKILVRGTAIDRGTPAEKIHRLRIDCKKLRYLLEVFGGLFPGDELPAAVRRLKKLQDNLGVFNDLEVQQHQLRDAGAVGGARRLPRETLLAMGRLVERLDARQAEVREEFYGRFAKFAKGDARSRLEPWFR